MQAQIKERTEVAKGTLMVVFDLLGHEVDFVSGQYFWVELPDVGYSDERGLRRHISVVTSPNDRSVLGLATRLRDSAFKRTLAELPVGAEVDVEDPKGDFHLPEDTTKDYVFIAGGIGITVVRSMLKYIAEENLPYRITLLYSNRDRESTAFFDELQEREGQIEGLEVVFTMTEDPGWDGETRRIDGDFIRDHLDGELESYTYIVSGPPGMVNGVADLLEGQGVPEEQVIRSRFSGY
jgi:ferredoxin-NADP reductase